jgi:gluconokinase
MSQGHPLTDADRQDWLEALRDHEEVHPPAEKSHLIMTCSALKREYRDILRQGSAHSHTLLTHFVFLEAPEEVLRQRAAARKGHFAGPELVRSQFAILENPGSDEADCSLIGVDRAQEEVQKDALEVVAGIIHESPLEGPK